MDHNRTALREQSLQNLREFLNIEVDLGMGYFGLAEHYLEKGDYAHYEYSKNKVLAAIETLDDFKDRLPPELRTEMNALRLELATLLSSL